MFVVEIKSLEGASNCIEEFCNIYGDYIAANDSDDAIYFMARWMMENGINDIENYEFKVYERSAK